ncbi:hypothetical protein HMI56_005411 [Coelomomyces lativittatus]|nr:hypothetical protein HMI56_005411 [Coelomomyces lativittatus]
MYSMLVADYPSLWPELNDQIYSCLQSNEFSEVHAGLLTLLEIIKIYQWKPYSQRTPLTRLLKWVMPSFLALAQTCSTSLFSLETFTLLHLILKSYHHTLVTCLDPTHVQTFHAWTHVWFQVLQLPFLHSLPFPGTTSTTLSNTTSITHPLSVGWMALRKCQKWGYRSLTVCLNRHLNIYATSYRPLPWTSLSKAKSFAKKTLPQVFPSVFHQCLSILPHLSSSSISSSSSSSSSPSSMSLELLTFPYRSWMLPMFFNALRHPTLWSHYFLPHLPTLLSQLILPMLQVTQEEVEETEEEDEENEEGENDPQRETHIKKSLDSHASTSLVTMEEVMDHENSSTSSLNSSSNMHPSTHPNGAVTSMEKDALSPRASALSWLHTLMTLRQECAVDVMQYLHHQMQHLLASSSSLSSLLLLASSSASSSSEGVGHPMTLENDVAMMDAYYQGVQVIVEDVKIDLAPYPLLFEHMVDFFLNPRLPSFMKVSLVTLLTTWLMASTSSSTSVGYGWHPHWIDHIHALASSSSTHASFCVFSPPLLTSTPFTLATLLPLFLTLLDTPWTPSRVKWTMVLQFPYFDFHPIFQFLSSSSLSSSSSSCSRITELLRRIVTHILKWSNPGGRGGGHFDVDDEVQERLNGVLQWLVDTYPHHMASLRPSLVHHFIHTMHPLLDMVLPDPLDLGHPDNGEKTLLGLNPHPTSSTSSSSFSGSGAGSSSGSSASDLVVDSDTPMTLLIQSSQSLVTYLKLSCRRPSSSSSLPRGDINEGHFGIHDEEEQAFWKDLSTTLIPFYIRVFNLKMIELYEDIFVQLELWLHCTQTSQVLASSSLVPTLLHRLRTSLEDLIDTSCFKVCHLLCVYSSSAMPTMDLVDFIHASPYLFPWPLTSSSSSSSSTTSASVFATYMAWLREWSLLPLSPPSLAPPGDPWMTPFKACTSLLPEWCTQSMPHTFPFFDRPGVLSLILLWCCQLNVPAPSWIWHQLTENPCLHDLFFTYSPHFVHSLYFYGLLQVFSKLDTIVSPTMPFLSSIHNQSGVMEEPQVKKDPSPPTLTQASSMSFTDETTGFAFLNDWLGAFPSWLVKSVYWFLEKEAPKRNDSKDDDEEGNGGTISSSSNLLHGIKLKNQEASTTSWNHHQNDMSSFSVHPRSSGRQIPLSPTKQGEAMYTDPSLVDHEDEVDNDVDNNEEEDEEHEDDDMKSLQSVSITSKEIEELFDEDEPEKEFTRFSKVNMMKQFVEAYLASETTHPFVYHFFQTKCTPEQHHALQLAIAFVRG